MQEIPIIYDQNGRMKYNPVFHRNMKKPWELEDLEYLKEWYYIIVPEEMSFALERTIQSIMQMAVNFRKKGVMKIPLKKIHAKRIK